MTLLGLIFDVVFYWIIDALVWAGIKEAEPKKEKPEKHVV